MATAGAGGQALGTPLSNPEVFLEGRVTPARCGTGWAAWRKIRTHCLRREAMSEDYCIISEPRGEPRSIGNVGVCVRIRLSGYPSRRWSRNLGARLTRELVGHRHVGHLRINVNDIVQGDEIVLDGVEDREAPAIASALQRAVDGANHAAAGEGDLRPNVAQHEAEEVAGHIVLDQPGDTVPSTHGDESPCPCCSQRVSMT